MAVEVSLPHPAAGQLCQALPLAREGQLKNDAYHPIVVILDLRLQTFPVGQDNGLHPLHHGRPGKTYICRGGALESWRYRPGSHNAPHLIQVNLLTHVVEDHHQD
jgi:hypothetical protein